MLLLCSTQKKNGCLIIWIQCNVLIDSNKIIALIIVRIKNEKQTWESSQDDTMMFWWCHYDAIFSSGGCHANHITYWTKNKHL